MTPAERDKTIRALYAERSPLLTKRRLGKPFNARLLKHIERQIDIHEMAEHEPARAYHRKQMAEIRATIRSITRDLARNGHHLRACE